MEIRATTLVFVGAVLLAHAVSCVTAADVQDEFSTLLKQTAQKAKTAAPEHRAQLQQMMNHFAEENGIDLKQLLTPKEWNYIFLEPGTYEDEDEDETEDDEEEVDLEEAARAAAEQQRKEAVIGKIRALLEERKPSMLKKLPALLKRYDGKEQELLEDLSKKYGA